MMTFPLFASHREGRKGRDTRGVAAVEFALVAPVLLVLALGIVDYGEMIWQQEAVDNAVAAGADYAVAYGWNPGGISGAEYAATPLSITPTQTEYTGCPSASGVAKTSKSTCSDGYAARTYVQVGAQTTYNLLLAWPGFPASITLNGSALARIGP